jgi:rhamnosyltransferase
MSSASKSVLAVVVAYRPNAETLRPLLHALLKQVNGVLIVDNSPADEDDVDAVIADFPELLSSLRLVRIGSNIGIGSALNIGISAAIEEGFEYVLLSDQDSLPAPDMVSQLVHVADGLRKDGVPVGYVGAAYVDRNTGHSFGFQVQEPDRHFYSTRSSDAADPWVEVITGITSGSLHPCSVFADVGMMREDWFIDYVDTEWFHRARAHGYRMFGTPRAVLSHHLGDLSFRVWYGRWRNYNGYSPQRLYYRFRNFVLLMRCAYVPARWKVRASWYWLGNAYAYLLFSPNRLRNLQFVCRGLWDGLCGRVGSIDSVAPARTASGESDGVP